MRWLGPRTDVRTIDSFSVDVFSDVLGAYTSFLRETEGDDDKDENNLKRSR